MSTTTQTSLEAVRSIAPILPTLLERVLSYIQSQGVNGATIDQTSIALGMRTATVCGRYGDLQKLGRIVQTGEIRKTSSGRGAMCWAIREAAQ